MLLLWSLMKSFSTIQELRFLAILKYHWDRFLLPANVFHAEKPSGPKPGNFYGDGESQAQNAER